MGLVVAILLGLAPTARGDLDVATKVASLLAEVGLAVEVRREALEALGDAALEPLFVALADGSTGREERQLALQVFAGLGDTQRRSFLKQTRAAEDPAGGRAEALLDVVRVAGRAADVPIALEAGEHMVLREHGSVTGAVADALEGVLRRDSRGWVGLDADVRSASPLVSDGLLRAVGRVGGEEAVHVLVDLVGFDSARDFQLLHELAAVARRTPVRLGERDLASVRETLWSHDELVQRAAATAVGELRDTFAIDPLLELLGSPEEAVRAAAARALEQVTGLRLGPDVHRWRRWVEAERAWLEETDAFDGLMSSDPVTVCRSLVEIGRHRYRREELVGAVLDVLDHPAVPVRRTAAATLAALGDVTAAPAMVPLLDDEPEVVAAVLKGLRTLTGLELGRDRRTWRESLLAAGLDS